MKRVDASDGLIGVGALLLIGASAYVWTPAVAVVILAVLVLTAGLLLGFAPRR